MEKIRLSKIKEYTKEEVKEYFADFCSDYDFETIWNDLRNNTRNNDFTIDVVDALYQDIEEEWPDLEIVKE